MSENPIRYVSSNGQIYQVREDNEPSFPVKQCKALVTATLNVAQVVLSGAAGAVATQKLTDYVTIPYRAPCNCTPLFSQVGLTVTKCMSWNKATAFMLGVGIPVVAVMARQAKHKQNEYGITKIFKATVFGALWGAAVGNALSGSTDCSFSLNRLQNMEYPFTEYEKAPLDNTIVGAAYGAVTCGTAEVIKQIFNAVI